MKNKISNFLHLTPTIWWSIVAISSLATFALSLYMGLGQSIWFDEGYSILLAENSYTDLIALTNVDAHPPLYYLLLKIWAEVFGWSELALRSLSALLTAGTVAISMILIKRLFNARIALLAAPLVVIAPFLLRYGYEVRMYALASLIGVVATLVFVHALTNKSDKRFWIIYGVLIALGMYTLYMTLVMWLAHLVWFLYITPKKQLLRNNIFISYIVALVVFLPQIPVFIYQMLNSALPGVGTELTLTKLVSVFGMLTVYSPEWRIGGWLSLVLIIGIILFGILYTGVMKVSKYKIPILFLTIMVVVPIIFYAVTSLPPRKPIFIERYMAHVSIYFYLLIATVAVLGYTLKYKHIARSFSAIIIIIAVVGIVRLHESGNLNIERMQLPETSEMRESINCDANTTIIADDPYTYIDSYYYFDSCKNFVYYSEKPLEFKGGYAPIKNGHERLNTSSDINTSKIVHLHWDGVEQRFTPSPDFRYMESRHYGKQVVTIYER